MKRSFLFLSAILFGMSTFAQEYSSELYDLGQYVQRVYMDEPFDGARIVENVDCCYLVSVVTETPSDNEYADFIESHSMGYVQTMQTASVFKYRNKKVYVFCKKMPMPDKPKGKKNRRSK